jgi:hypothetical protein
MSVFKGEFELVCLAHDRSSQRTLEMLEKLQRPAQWLSPLREFHIYIYHMNIDLYIFLFLSPTYIALLPYIPTYYCIPSFSCNGVKSALVRFMNDETP